MQQEKQHRFPANLFSSSTAVCSTRDDVCVECIMPLLPPNVMCERGRHLRIMQQPKLLVSLQVVSEESRQLLKILGRHILTVLTENTN